MAREGSDPRYLTPLEHRRPAAHADLPSATETARGLMTPEQVRRLEALEGAVAPDLSGYVTAEALEAALRGYVRRGAEAGAYGDTGSFELVADLRWLGTELQMKTLVVTVANGLVSAIGAAGDWATVPTTAFAGGPEILQGLGSKLLATQGYGG